MTQNLLFNIGEMFKGLWEQMGIANGVWQNDVMLLVSFVLFYLAIVKKFEPLLLLPIAFGMFIVNIPGAYDIVWGTYPILQGKASRSFSAAAQRANVSKQGN